MPPLPKPTSFFNSMLGQEEKGSDTKKKNKKYKIPDPATAEFNYSVATPVPFADREIAFKAEEYLLMRSLLKHFSSMEDEVESSSEKTDAYLNHMKENKEEMINETTEATDFVTVKFTSIQAHALYDFLMNLSSLFHSIDSTAKTKKIDDLAYLFHKAADQGYRY